MTFMASSLGTGRTRENRAGCRGKVYLDAVCASPSVKHTEGMLRKFGHVLALLALLVVELLAIVSSVLTLMLTFGLGMVFLFPPQVRMIRWVTMTTRRVVHASTGVTIEPPYLPQ